MSYFLEHGFNACPLQAGITQIFTDFIFNWNNTVSRHLRVNPNSPNFYFFIRVHPHNPYHPCSIPIPGKNTIKNKTWQKT